MDLGSVVDAKVGSFSLKLLVHSRFQRWNVTEADEKIWIAVVAKLDVDLDREGIDARVRATVKHFAGSLFGLRGALAFNCGRFDKNRTGRLSLAALFAAVRLANKSSGGAHDYGSFAVVCRERDRLASANN